MFGGHKRRPERHKKKSSSPRHSTSSRPSHDGVTSSQTRNGEQDVDVDLVAVADGAEDNPNVPEEVEGNNNENDQEDNASTSSEESEEPVVQVQLPPSTYSLMIASPVFSIPWWIGFLVCAFQMVLLFLLLRNVVEVNIIARRGEQQEAREDNPLDIPAGVSTEVLFAQFFGLFFVVLTQEDLHFLIQLAVKDGYHATMENEYLEHQDKLAEERRLKEEQQQQENGIVMVDHENDNQQNDDQNNQEQGEDDQDDEDAEAQAEMEEHRRRLDITFSKWLFSVALLTIVSGMTVTTVFLVTITSEEVLDVLLGFAVAEFISAVDGDLVCFNLMLHGFLGKRAQQYAVAISEVEFPVTHTRDCLGACFGHKKLIKEKQQQQDDDGDKDDIIVDDEQGPLHSAKMAASNDDKDVPGDEAEAEQALLQQKPAHTNNNIDDGDDDDEDELHYKKGSIKDRMYQCCGYNPYLKSFVFVLVGLYVFLVAMWAIVYSRQQNGEYAPQYIVVQFDDTIDKSLGLYSGLYRLKINTGTFGYNRLRYVRDNGDNAGEFGYCREDRIWTFFLPGDGPCDYIAHSEETDSFRITDSTIDGPWNVRAPNAERERFYPMDDGVFQLMLPCNVDDDCGEEEGVRGTCDHHYCNCRENYFGIRCDYSVDEVCGKLEIDPLSSEPFEGNREYASSFEVLMQPKNKVDEDGEDMNKDDKEDDTPLPILINHKPIFLSELNPIGEGDVLFYTGLRWAMFPLPEFVLNMTNGTATREDIAEYFYGDFVESFAILDFFFSSPEFFMSDVVKFNQPTDRVAPLGADVFWNQAVEGGQNTADGGGAAIVLRPREDTNLICAVCDDASNPCSHNNTCAPTGECICNNGAYGTLCRITPVSDAVCNSAYFNDNLFGYDGGDCCENSCVSTSETLCGFEQVSLQDGNLTISEQVNVRYPNCKDPESVCINSPDAQDQCWAPRSESISLSEDADAASTVLRLASNGRLLVQSSPFTETISVWDQKDSTWTQRGDELSGVRGSRFGQELAISSPPADVTNIMAKSDSIEGVNVIIAASLYRRSDAGARVFTWDASASDWLELGEEISFCTGGCNVQFLGVGYSQTHATLVAGIDDSTSRIYQILLNADDEEETSPSWNLIETVSSPYVAVSRDGRTVAVLSNAVSVGVDVAVYHISDFSAESRMLQTVSHATIADIDNVSLIQILEFSQHGDFLTIVVQGVGVDADTIVSMDTKNFTAVDANARRHTVKVIDPPMSRAAIRAGFFPLNIANDGTALAVMVDAVFGPKIDIYNFDNGWIKYQTTESRDDVEVEVDTAFAISSAAATSLILSSQEGTLEAFQLLPFCPGGSDVQTKWRLSIPLQTGTETLSYSLSSYMLVGSDKVVTNTVDVDCQECLSDDVYAATLLSEEGCISSKECLELSFHDSDTSQGLKWMSLFQDEKLKWSTIVGPTEETYSLENDDGCQVLESCPEGEEMFVLAFTSDRAAWSSSETNWKLSLQDGTVALLNDPQSLETPFHRACVPSVPSQCMTFEILDDYGDGLCCNVGEGRYAIYLGDNKVIAREGEAFAYGERVRFGNCNTQVESAVSIALSFAADPQSRDIRWRIEDGAGIIHAASTTPLSSDTRFTLFPSDVSGCLFLFVDDDGGNGNKGYTLTNDGEEVVSRNGVFRHYERTQFAASSLTAEACPTTVVQASDMKLQLFVGNDPSNLSWYLGNIEGEPLGAISEGKNVAGNQVVQIDYNPVTAGNPDDCFTFTVINNEGRSIDAWYSVTVGIENIVSQRGNLAFGERIRFGNSCPQTDGLDIIRAVPIMVNVTFDHFPHETRWWVEDRDGVKLLQSDDARNSVPNPWDPDSEVAKENHFPEEEDEQCLYFYITDEEGDGICCLADNFPARGGNDAVQTLELAEHEHRRLQTAPSAEPSLEPSQSPSITMVPTTSSRPSLVPSSAPSKAPSSSPSASPSESMMPSMEPSVTRVNGGFELLANEQIVYTGSGIYGNGERVRFGGNCPVEVNPLVHATILLQIDSGGNQPFTVYLSITDNSRGVTVWRATFFTLFLTSQDLLSTFLPSGGSYTLSLARNDGGLLDTVTASIRNRAGTILLNTVDPTSVSAASYEFSA